MSSPGCLIVVDLPSLDSQGWQEIRPRDIGEIQSIIDGRETALLNEQNDKELTTLWDEQFSQQFW